MPSTFRYRSRLAMCWGSAIVFLLVAASAFGQVSLLSEKDGALTGDKLGWKVAGIGDINNDGISDYIVGAPYADPLALSAAGSAYVYSGANGALLYQKNGAVTNERLGSWVAGAGDVNGDGRPDFIVGNETYIYVYSGANGSLLYLKTAGGPAAGAGDVNGDGKADFLVSAITQVYVYSGATGVLLYQHPGGSSIAGLGDVNGDGKSDYIIGDQTFDYNGITNSGAARVYSGATGTVLYEKFGSTQYDVLGNSVGGAGDVNGDGRADFMIGARLANPGGLSDAGSIWVYSGATGALLYQKNGTASGQHFGETVTGAGDVDGDGKADFLVGTIDANPGGLTGAGTAMLYSGATGATLAEIDGKAAYENLGYSLSMIGDLNGNGKSEFIIGAPLTDPSLMYDAGSAYIYGYGGGTSCQVVAQFVASTSIGTAPLAVNFTDQSTGSPSSWSWSFGDGATSTAQSPSHTFSAAGTYTVTLTASAGSCSNSKSSAITVSAPACALVASFSASPTSVTTGQTVTLTDKSTGSPTAWSWSFGDGTTSTLQNPTHVYSAAGTFTVTEIISAGSCKDTATGTITVTTPTCAVVAQFSASPTSGTAPLAVTFTNQSIGSPTSWSWNFGDGSTSTAQSPSHSYSAAGTYSVTLTASSATCSNTITKTNYIVVSAPSTGMQVASITVLEELVSRKYRGKATVVVFDASNRPVSGATVSGSFNVPNASIKTGTTDAYGQAIIYSDNAKKTQTFCFTVTNVSKVGYTYTVVGAAPSACEYATIANREIQGADISGLPVEAALDQNYPNPFNPRTEISYSLPAASHVTIEIYNVIGAKIATLVDRTEDAGSHTVSWDANGNASGVYFYRMTADNFSVTKKMLLLK